MHFLDRLGEYLMIMGIPGLLAISFLDSAAVPIVGGPDALILLLAWKRPAMAHLIVLAATAGSTLGCLVLYGIGRKGGEKALSRFNPERIAKVERRMREHGIWAVIASVIAPPPFPTKLIILAAGVLRIGRIGFTSGVFAGRLVRYSLIGYLAAKYGDRAAQVLKAHYPVFSLVLIACIILIIFIRSRRSAVRGG
ncbi:MAG: associated Golgi protein [Acidobacteria bacterium]|nr:associated Golgi protein [Acidobacteriota bacterium]